jgi:sec-independent protein translocase protein TatB
VALFDVGFQEIVLISVIALLVIGPERLPSVARSVGLWVGKVQRFVAGVKTDINRELQNDELRGLLNSQEDQIRELKETLTETRNEFARSASIASSSLSEGMSSAVEQVRGAAEAVKDNADQASKQPSETAKPAVTGGEGSTADTSTASTTQPADDSAKDSAKPDKPA